MPAVYCQFCERLIDLDYDVDHFDENEVCRLELENVDEDLKLPDKYQNLSPDDDVFDMSGASHDNNGNEYPDGDR